MLQAFAQWLMGYLSAWGQWILDGFNHLALLAVSGVFDGILVVFEGLGQMLPSGLSNTPPAVVGGVAWAVAPLELGSGLALLGSAYLIRFLIRRIPVIG